MLRAHDLLGLAADSLFHVHELFQSILNRLYSEIALLVGINLLKDLLKFNKLLFSGGQVGQQGDDAGLELIQSVEGLDGAHELLLALGISRLRR